MRNLSAGSRGTLGSALASARTALSRPSRGDAGDLALDVLAGPGDGSVRGLEAAGLILRRAAAGRGRLRRRALIAAGAGKGQCGGGAECQQSEGETGEFHRKLLVEG